MTLNIYVSAIGLGNIVAPSGGGGGYRYVQEDKKSITVHVNAPVWPSIITPPSCTCNHSISSMINSKPRLSHDF